MGASDTRDYKTFKGLSFKERVIDYVKTNGIKESVKHVQVSLSTRIHSKIRIRNLKKMYDDIISQDFAAHFPELCNEINYIKERGKIDFFPYSFTDKYDVQKNELKIFRGGGGMADLI